MPLKNLGGVIKSVNDATRAVNNVTRTANNVKRTGNDVKRTVGGTGLQKKQPKLSKQAKAAAANLWACACGASNATKFCGGCGKPAPTETICAGCGWKRPVENGGMKFCGECGAKFEEEGE
jgi:membrane protease subunit (stomatin/prohibitin family)